MGFNSVYRVLQEVFPQVDPRVLRAVAIEHAKDADAAVEVVLVEVLPCLPKGISESGSSKHIPAEEACCPGSAENTLKVDSAYLGEPSGTLKGSSYYHATTSPDQVGGCNGNEELISLGKQGESSVSFCRNLTSHVDSEAMINESSADYDLNQLHVDSGKIISVSKTGNFNVGALQGLDVAATALKHDDVPTKMSSSGNLMGTWHEFGGPSASNNMCMDGEIHREQLYLDGGNHMEVKNSVGQLDPSFSHEWTPDAPESSLVLAAVPRKKLNSDYEKPEPSGTPYSASKKDKTASEMVDYEENAALDSVVTRSGQICRIDLLEDAIEDARNNKKTLFSAMESVISLMREVELHEKAAELAKEEAVRGCLDILTRAEDLKQMVQHVKEANDMHAGEVYGEKAILATEVKELQFRLLSLADERDKSLAILDEMRQSLKERLDAAEKERQAAELEKIEKEASAKNAIAEQQLIMEKVIQESKMLEQEAEENSKLREFLVDRGRVVDMLQGELSVICHNAKLLKEKFDEHIPLSKSLSFGQTSSILASSSSSLKSMKPDQVPEQTKSSETPKETSPRFFISDQFFPKRFSTDDQFSPKKTNARFFSDDLLSPKKTSPRLSVIDQFLPKRFSSDDQFSPKKTSPRFFPDDLLSPKKMSPRLSVEDQFSSGADDRKALADEDQLSSGADDRKALADDGWVFFYNQFSQ